MPPCDACISFYGSSDEAIKKVLHKALHGPSEVNENSLLTNLWTGRERALISSKWIGMMMIYNNHRNRWKKKIIALSGVEELLRQSVAERKYTQTNG